MFLTNGRTIRRPADILPVPVILQWQRGNKHYVQVAGREREGEGERATAREAISVTCLPENDAERPDI